MANTDKNILITPSIGLDSLPSIAFTGFDNNPITLDVLDSGTLSFSGTSGQLFSISDDLTGTIFSVNDISGIPSIEVIDDGTIILAEYTGNLLIGTTTDNALDKVQVTGNLSATNITRTIIDDYTNVVHADATHARVKALVSLSVGQAVSYSGYNSGEDAQEAILADNTVNVSIGIMGEALAIGEYGHIVTNGILENVDTSGFTEKDILYVSTAGALTATEPTTGFSQPIAYVLRSHAVNGAIMVNATYPKQDAQDVRFDATKSVADELALKVDDSEYNKATIDAMGIDAETLDSLDSTQFLRSDQSDTMTGSLTIGDGTADTRLIIKRIDGPLADDIQFYSGTTRVGEIGTSDTAWLRINQHTAKNIYTPRYIRADEGLFVNDSLHGITAAGLLANASLSGTYTGALTLSNASNAFTGDLSGNATTATTLETTRTFDITGDLTTTAQNFNGSQNVVLAPTINNDAVTYAKMQNIVSANRLLGSTSANGIVTELDSTAIRSMINVESGATGDQTAAEILALLLTVDGTGSNLNSDFLDGTSAAGYALAGPDFTGDVDTLKREGLYRVNGTSTNAPTADFYTFIVAGNNGNVTSQIATHFQTGATYVRAFNTVWTSWARLDNDASDILAKLLTVDGTGSLLDADKLDGQEGSYYRNATNINAGTISDTYLPASISSDITGNAATATKWATARTLTLSGDITGSVSFDGSGAINMTNTVVANDSHTHNYDNYNGWDLLVNGVGTNRITSGEDVNFVGGTNATLSQVGTTVTVNVDDSFIKNNADDTMTGQLTVGSTGATPLILTRTSDTNINLKFQGLTASGYLGINPSSELKFHPTDANLSSVGYTIWHSNNLSFGTGATNMATGNHNHDTVYMGINAAYTKAQTDTEISTAVSGLVDTAPGALDTLNELAAALGDDPAFATTVTNSIAEKVAKTGDTMTGSLAINSNVTGVLSVSNSSNTVASISSPNTYLSISAGSYVQITKPIINSTGLWFNNNSGIRSLESDASWIDLMLLDTNNIMKIGTLNAASTNGDVALYTNGVERIRIDDVGDVGIGLTVPSEKLDVNGNVKATSFIGSLTGNASTATKLATTRSIGLINGVTGAANFDGSSNISISATVNYLTAVDDRDVKPNTTGITGAGVKAIKPFFTSLEGMTGAVGTDYQDLLVFDTYSDGSGGDMNALTFDKSENLIRSWQADQTATTWGTPETVAFRSWVSTNFEPDFTKNTGFNKDFGSIAGTVTQGNDARLSDARTPLTHTHTGTTISDLDAGDTTSGVFMAARIPTGISITGNAATATKLSSTRTFALTGDVTGTINSDLTSGVSIATTVLDNSHNHTSLTNMTSIGFAADGSDSASIGTTINGAQTYFDFNLTDDNNQEQWRWRFTPSGSTVYNAMSLVPVSNGNANLLVSGLVSADSFTEGGITLSSKYLGLTSKAADSDKLDNLDSTQFLRSDVSDIKSAGALTFNDNVYAIFGTSAGSQLFSNGTSLYLDLEANTDKFYIRDGSTVRYTFDKATSNLTATTFTGNLTGNASTVSNGVYTTSVQALHATDALRISGSVISLYKGNGAFESVTVPGYTLPVATDTVLGGVKGGPDITVDGSGELTVVNNSHTHISANITDATSANTANMVVKRDASGDINAGNINAETAVNLGSTQEATIEYNATENSIDFIIN